METEIRKADIMIYRAPVSVGVTCPYCEEEIDIDYDEFRMIVGDFWECQGMIVDCPSCREGFEIDDYDVD